MKTAFRLMLLVLALCALPLSAQQPRQIDRGISDAKPLIVDGVRYDRSEIERFKAEPTMYWVLERDATYGFTTPEGVKAYGEEHAKVGRPEGPKHATGALITGPNCAGFNKNVGCGGIDWLPLCTPDSIPHISDSWNDVISCVETGSSIGKYTVLYKCYYYDPTYPNCSHILWIPPNYTVPDLNVYSMNNIVSSIRFCSNVDPYSCT